MDSLADRLRRDLAQYQEAVYARYIHQCELHRKTLESRDANSEMERRLFELEHENERMHLALEHSQHDTRTWQVLSVLSYLLK